MYRYIILYVFMLLSKMSVHSIPWSLPPSLFIVLKNIVGFDLALPFALVLLQHFFTHFFLFCIFSATSILNMTWQLCMHDTQNRADTGKTEKNI